MVFPCWGQALSRCFPAGVRLAGCAQPSLATPTCEINLWQGQPSSPSSEIRCFCCPTLLFSAQPGVGTAPQPTLPRLFPEGPDPGDSHPAPTVLGTALGLGAMGGRSGGKEPLPALPGWFPAPGWFLEVLLVSKLNPARRHLQRLGRAPCN